MSLSEQQLITWSNQGAVVTAKSTHESIRNTIARYNWPVAAPECHLQGSYANDTNIRGNSDVDLFVQNNDSFFSNLSYDQKQDLRLIDASYGWEAFRDDVIKALSDYYGWASVDSSGVKSVKVAGGNSRLDADVVVCCEYRLYRSGQVAATGIGFRNRKTNELIVNYPKLHYENGVAKNSRTRTNGWYKPSVRMFKNARTRITEAKPYLADWFPSYFVECILYNVPDSFFGQSYQSTYATSTSYLIKLFDQGRASSLKCQNGIDNLFGASSTQWREEYARTFVEELCNL